MNCLLVHNPLMLFLDKILSKFSLFNDLVQYSSSIILKGINKNFIKYLFSIGSVALTLIAIKQINLLIKSLGWIINHQKNIRNLTKQNLIKRYGQCWVGITGFTGGIGWEYTNLFAKFGYKLLLIDMNEKNVNKSINKLKNIYPQIQIKHIIADLSQQKNVEILSQTINNLSKQIEIGIFINNAGFVSGGQFLSINPVGLVTCSQVNINSVIRLSKQMINIFQKRQSRSALVNMSSCTGLYISSHVGVYSMTKKMLDIYTQFLNKEHGSNIDIISVRPFGVITNMMKMRKNWFMITPKNCVESAIADCLAGQKNTFTGFKHKLMNFMFQTKKEQDVLQIFADAWKQGNK